MSVRALSLHESIDLENHHSDLHQRINQFNWWVRQGGWDQIASARAEATAGGDWLAVLLHPTSLFVTQPPTIPPRGVAVADEVYGDVVVYPDPAGVLHFIATDNASLISEIQKPVFHSDPDYLALFNEIAARYAEAIPKGLELGTAALIIGAAIVISGSLGGRR